MDVYHLNGKGEGTVQMIHLHRSYTVGWECPQPFAVVRVLYSFHTLLTTPPITIRWWLYVLCGILGGHPERHPRAFLL